jgi:hypothetical protein
MMYILSWYAPPPSTPATRRYGHADEAAASTLHPSVPPTPFSLCVCVCVLTPSVCAVRALAVEEVAALQLGRAQALSSGKFRADFQRSKSPLAQLGL